MNSTAVSLFIIAAEVCFAISAILITLTFWGFVHV